MNRFMWKIWCGLPILFGFLLLPLLVSSQEAPVPSAQGDLFVAQPAVREVTLTGYTRARHVMDIISEEAGRCSLVTADVGETIAKDGVFAKLDRTFIDLDIEKNRVAQKRMENRIAYHAKEVRRYEKLVARETAAQSKLDSLQNQLDQSKLELETLKVDAAHLMERRARHVVRVPAGWAITERAVEPGEWISVGKQLGRAGDFRTLLIPYSLSPEEYNALKKLKGPLLRFPDEGTGGLSVEASLERISPAFDPQTRKINVDLGVRKGLPRMRGGLRAELTLKLPDPSGAVLVPTSAMSERYEEFWLTRPNGEQVRIVRLGHGPGNTTRVRSPEVKPGDTFRVKPEQ